MRRQAHNATHATNHDQPAAPTPGVDVRHQGELRLWSEAVGTAYSLQHPRLAAQLRNTLLEG
ncbi:MAG: hypothetical protein K6T26_07755 [Alicyclobacillus sp.]|nr:hypothetical protein [Alicyclobacillus sp.]